MSKARAAAAKVTAFRCQRAWTTSTAYVAPVEWQVAQASAGAVEPGKYAVLIRACAATSRLSWQPVHAAVGTQWDLPGAMARRGQGHALGFSRCSGLATLAAAWLSGKRLDSA